MLLLFVQVLDNETPVAYGLSIADAAFATRWLWFERCGEMEEKEENTRWQRVGRIREGSAPIAATEVSGQLFQQSLCFLKIEDIKAFVKLTIDG
jgi:hypothetical protein